jgi:hypothetical protein
LSYALDLLEQARHLAFREPKRPKQASLRRSVSTAYYALFHLLTSEAVRIIAPSVSDSSRYKMQRWFDHKAMHDACTAFSNPLIGRTRALSDLIDAPAPSAELLLIARAFVQLQEARHRADYDLGVTWTRFTSQQHVQLADQAFDAWTRIRKSAEANVFALGLFDLKRVTTERS